MRCEQGGNSACETVGVPRFAGRPAPFHRSLHKSKSPPSRSCAGNFAQERSLQVARGTSRARARCKWRGELRAHALVASGAGNFARTRPLRVSRTDCTDPESEDSLAVRFLRNEHLLLRTSFGERRVHDGSSVRSRACRSTKINQQGRRRFTAKLQAASTAVLNVLHCTVS